MENVQQYIDMAWAMILQYTPKVLLALLTLFIGLKIINGIIKLMDKIFEKNKVDPTLRPFVGSLLSWGLKIMLFISIASMIGVQTTSFVAVLGAAGLAVGLALQGTLANFAGGALIMVFKPYKVGDLIEAQGHIGVVKEIQIFTTMLTSPQNKMVIIPNGSMSNGNIVNYTTLGLIRVDLSIGIAYNADIDTAKKILLEVMESDERILKDPAPFVGVSELADSAVNLAVRPHCNPLDYWGVYFDTLENGKKALDKNKVTIPFPQMDVHLFKQ